MEEPLDPARPDPASANQKRQDRTPQDQTPPDWTWRERSSSRRLQPGRTRPERSSPHGPQPSQTRPEPSPLHRPPPSRTRPSQQPRRPWPGQAAPDHRARADRGSGTILFLALVGVTATLMTVTLGLGLAVSTRHRAAAAADLAALAAIDSAEGCPAAARVAGANRARLSRCEFLADGTVVVSVVIDEPRLPRPVLGSARAGPGPAQMAPTPAPRASLTKKSGGPVAAGGCALSAKLVTPSGRCGPLE